MNQGEAGMERLDDVRREEREGDLGRVANEIAGRLRSRGVDVLSSDTPEDVAALLDAVEAFELAVEEQGGDLMLVEPPEGVDAEPDETTFVLPRRRPSESASDYVRRLQVAAAAVRQHPPSDTEPDVES
jgi:hypothetical protein